MVDHSEIRFGTIALGKEFITPSQLGKAVGLQMKMDLEKGIHRLLGEILVEMGFMTPSEVEEVIQEQRQMNKIVSFSSECCGSPV